MPDMKVILEEVRKSADVNALVDEKLAHEAGNRSFLGQALRAVRKAEVEAQEYVEAYLRAEAIKVMRSQLETFLPSLGRKAPRRVVRDAKRAIAIGHFTVAKSVFARYGIRC